ncbi:pyruvate ferredoxin oxidoreductase delta subunit [Dehalogenimonas formicexedens]|uniref:Pyruvate ferredoxin oxidoreductase delta subunit n=1 Tax=Dehalogenimonas formicexedens TaxID=1839801 RepID=A0A1P8F6S0_9CHLR|nr:4Fe-4S dicluster domain-containing protein [Dehalogenimonas formicexedens]APV44130.1 pyruvate ferredoxin oxidoreductase delta subunit [Dehalogenimonas formicexedens]
MAKSEFELTWQDIEIGAAVTEPGSAAAYKTGDWKSQRPTYDFSRCLKCGICYVFCPEGCVRQNQKGHFEANPYYCKGCGICAYECPTRVIVMREEEEK